MAERNCSLELIRPWQEMRAKPFSGKKKKAQLQDKRQKKADRGLGEIHSNLESSINQGTTSKQQNKLTSQWETRTDSKKPTPYDNPDYLISIEQLDNEALETSFDQIYGPNQSSNFALPTRPSWDYDMSKEELEGNEKEYFKSWLDGIYQSCPNPDELSFFEHNLEVWRQLWRVCEISDVLLIVADIRHPVLNFPPSLYTYISNVLKKPLYLVLTKTDLVANEVVQEWVAYIKRCFPLVMVVDLSIYNLEALSTKKPKRYNSASGAESLLKLLREDSPKPFREEWDQYIGKRFGFGRSSEEDILVNDSLGDKDYYTIGSIGHPNAGKSSLINSILGRKIVSASRTPGHTKHFQTIHLTKHIRLCDCPGLIFPMSVPKWLQIVSGLYNVAQVKDPYEPLMHLAALIDISSVLGLPPKPRNILQVCEDFAELKGFHTAKAARPDIYRAANFILRAVIDGRILLSWKPPDYYKLHNEERRPKLEFLDQTDSDEEETHSEGAEIEAESKPLTGVLGGSFGGLLEEAGEQEEEDS